MLTNSSIKALILYFDCVEIFWLHAYEGQGIITECVLWPVFLKK